MSGVISMDKELNKELKEKFLKEVNVGDIVKIEYENGFFKKKTETVVGFVNALTPFYVGLRLKDTIKNPEIIGDGDGIYFKAMSDYKKL